MATTGGAGGAAGSEAAVPNEVSAVLKSAGCGKPVPEGQTAGSYTDYSVHVTGATLTDFTWPEHDRKYHVWVPTDYDSNKAYQTVFIGYGCGDKYAGATATYKLMDEDPEKIYVGMDMPPDGIADNEGACYNDDGGMNSTEWEFFGLAATEVEASFCVDQHRVYVAGYSSGAWLANMLGCYFAGVDPNRKFGPTISLRGQMTVTGGLPAIPACGGKIAAMWIHDEGDGGNVIGGSISALDRVLAVDGCTGSPTEPWGEGSLANVCKRYTACPAEYPVVFCTTQGRGHDAQNDNALPGFTQFMQLIKAP